MHGGYHIRILSEGILRAPSGHPAVYPTVSASYTLSLRQYEEYAVLDTMPLPSRWDDVIWLQYAIEGLFLQLAN